MSGIAGILLTAFDAIDPHERLRAMLPDCGPPVPLQDGRAAVGAGSTDQIASDGELTVLHDGSPAPVALLRQALVEAGATSSERNPARLILEAVRVWGVAGAARRLDDGHAFCLVARDRGSVTIVRDRLGCRPMYVVERACGLAFASSLRALARSGLCLPKLDETALWTVLSRGTSGDRTLIAGVRRLDPGSILEWNAITGEIVRDAYWTLPTNPGTCHVSFDEALTHARNLLTQAAGELGAVDLPLAASEGGQRFATSLLTAERGAPPIETLAEELTTEAHVRASLDRVIVGSDDPASVRAVAATTFAERAKVELTAAFVSAVGIDELFASRPSYGAFRENRSEPSYRRLENGERYERERAIMRERLGSAFPAVGADARARYTGSPFTAQPEFILALLAPDRRPPIEGFRGALESLEADLLDETGRLRTPLQRALYLDARLGLEGRIASEVIEPSRLTGATVLAPFADYRFLEFSLALPDVYKLDDDGPRLLRALGVTDQRDELSESLMRVRPLVVERGRQATSPLGLVDEGVLSDRALPALVAVSEIAEVSEIIWTVLAVDAWWQRTRADIVAALPERGAIPRLDLDREPRVDIVIPIYESLNLVRDCVRSIQAFTKRDYRVLLIDDASNPAMHERLRALVADDPRFEVHRNESNLGFLETCLRGLTLATSEYVVLLNSDTVVSPGWLEGMVACAESDPRIAIVNPLSNEAANLSVRIAPGLNITSMASRVARVSRRSYPDVVTAVGMCMLIRRSAVELLGGFDKAFAPAYCEESDLCMRFTEAGLRVVVADDTFVYHKGSASYGEERMRANYRRNRKEFDRRWSVPYERDLTAYARRDPLQYVRDALLRGTVDARDGARERFEVIESRLDRLESREILAASLVGERAAAGAALVPAGAPFRGAEQFREWAIGRLERPPARFHERALVFPTRQYVRDLPPAGAGALRVTFLVSSLPLAGGVISILHVARELMLAGHDVKLVTEAHENAPEVLNLWAQPIVFRDRQHLVDAFPESDVVIATWWVTSHRYLRELRRRYRFVAAYYVQDYEAMFYPETDVENRRDAIRSYDWADHHVYASEWIAERVGPRDAKVEVIPLDVDLDIFYPRHERRTARPRVVSVAAPGAETRRRGFPETVDAFRRIHEARPDVELVFFGADTSRMPELPFPYTNAGRLYDQNRVAELVASADVLVDASLWQGFGRPGLEAMACGTVPVLTGVGGVHEYARDGVNALLTPSGDSAAVADAVLRLLSDEDLRSRLAANAIASAQGFSHREIGARHLRLYQRWVDEARSAATVGDRRGAK